VATWPSAERAAPPDAQALPTFGFVTVHRQPLANGVAHEAEWLAGSAARAQASAHLWTAPTGIVVPRRYTALRGWAAAMADAGHGELQVRASGGGLVPQGPGVWNLSLTWPAPGAVPTGTDAVYRGLCSALAAALARLGLDASPQPVAGSFCDGRYNLAVHGRKLAGTAQAWRRVGGVPMVLAHAVIVVDADPAALTARANAFEAALGTPTRYRSDALTSVGLASSHPDNRADIEARAITALAEQFAGAVPARDHHPKEIEHGAA
jgi:lipoate-protein ligase A